MISQLLILLLTVFPNSICTTPDDGIKEYEVLIGYNSNSYYSMKTINYPRETYFESKDSAFLIERSLATCKMISRIFLSSRHHLDSTTLGDWKTKESINAGFDYADFLKKKKIKYLYPSIYRHTTYRNIWFEIDLEGIKISYKEEKSLLIDIEKVELFAPWVKDYLTLQEEVRQQYPKSKLKYVTIFDVIGDEKYLFIIVEGKYDPQYIQSIVIIRKDKLNPDIKKLFD